MLSNSSSLSDNSSDWRPLMTPASSRTVAPLLASAAYAAVCVRAVVAFVRRKATWRHTVFDSFLGEEINHSLRIEMADMLGIRVLEIKVSLHEAVS